MNLVPDKLFVNLYPKSIGPCVGSAFETKADADKCANSHRLLCVELGARVATSVVLSELCHAVLTDLAKKNNREIAWVVENSLAIHRAIPNEIRGLLHRYAAEHQINFATAVAECCRGYLTEAAR
jgi:hypothetical protein